MMIISRKNGDKKKSGKTRHCQKLQSLVAISQKKTVEKEDKVIISRKNGEKLQSGKTSPSSEIT